MAARAAKLTLVSVLSAIAAAIGTVLYLTQFSESGRLSISEQFSSAPDVDTYLEGVEGIKYAANGATAYRWRADSAERRISDGAVSLAEPFYIGNIAEQRPWTASARRGRLSQNGQQLQLSEAVLVKDLIRQAEISTEQLNIDLADNSVATEAEVTLKLRNGVTHSTGLSASLKEEKVDLLSKVRGRYEPQ